MDKACENCQCNQKCLFIDNGECFACPVVLIGQGEEDYLTVDDFRILESINPELYAEVVARSEAQLGIGGFG